MIISTPGRLIELVTKGGVDIRHIGYLVIDECDRMA